MVRDKDVVTLTGTDALLKGVVISNDFEWP